MFPFIFAFVPLILLLGGVLWIVASRKQARQITISFPPQATWFGLVILVGFHLGLYGTFSSDIFPSLGFLVFGLLTSLAWTVIYWKKWTPIITSLLVIMMISVLMMPMRASGFIQGINFVMFGVVNTLLFLRLIRQSGVQTLLRVCHDGVYAGLQSVGQLIALFNWLRNEKSSANQQKIIGWLKTLSLALIGALVFIVLLSQADPIFAQLVKDLQEQLIGRFIWTLLIVIALAVGLSMRQKQEDTPYQLKWFSHRDAIVMVTAVSFVIASFLVVQWQYLFGSSRELLDYLNLSYSEYVRKGFVELLVATLIGGGLSYFLAIKLRNGKTNGKRFWLLLVGNTILIAELFALLISAYKRDLLYVETYGFTRVRIIGEVFLVWLACLLLILLLFALWRKLKERSALLLFGTVSVVAWLGLQVVNVDAIIARGAPGHHDYTDYFYIMQLSEDAAREQLALMPKVIEESKQFLDKPSLTDKEKSQLAGLKLALLTFQEHADDLYFHHAGESEIIANSDQYFQEWPFNRSTYNADIFTCQETNQTASYHFISPADCKKELRGLSPRLELERSWRFFQPKRSWAYELWFSNAELMNSISQTIVEIRMYQKITNITLAEQETRLLREFSYPFLSVGLRYYPGSDDAMNRDN